MSDRSPTVTTAPGAVSARAFAGEDWPAQTADSIERFVDTIRSKTTEPVERAVRIVVYGVLAAVLGLVALVLLAVAVVRALDVAVPGEVWSAHLIVGVVFSLLGLFLWSRRGAAGDRG